MGAYAIVHMDLSTGRRTLMPERFPTPLEAQDRLQELSRSEGQGRYLIQFLPASAS